MSASQTSNSLETARSSTAEAPAGVRRRLVKSLGKKFLHGGVDRFIAHQSLIPDTPVLDPEWFPWAAEFQSNWPDIRAELDPLMRAREDLPNFQDISPDQYRISPDSQWKTFVLRGFGKDMPLGRELCPRTMDALRAIPGLTTAFFSMLAPGKHIPRHRGVTKALVRCHLGLKVPRAAERCVIEVDDVRRAWREGELLFFDDTYEHEVWNDTDEERAVLFIDFERPMRPWGRRVTHAVFSLLRRSAYVRDAQRNQQAWEEAYRRAKAERARSSA